MPTKPWEDAKTLVAYLVAGFAAVVGFLGIKSQEVSTVIRNGGYVPSIVALTLVVAIVVAVMSVAMSDSLREKKVSGGVVLGVLILVGSLGPLWIVALPLPISTSQFAIWVAAGVSVGMAVVGGLLLWIARDRGGEWFDLQTLLLLTSILLTALSIFGGLRLETRSQTTIHAQVFGTVVTQSNDDQLTIGVSVSHVDSPGWVEVQVRGLPVRSTLQNVCGHSDDPFALCSQVDPCGEYSSVSGKYSCREIAAWQVPPDSDGSIDRQLELPIPLNTYAQVRVGAEICQPKPGTSDCEVLPGTGTPPFFLINVPKSPPATPTTIPHPIPIPSPCKPWSKADTCHLKFPG